MAAKGRRLRYQPTNINMIQENIGRRLSKEAIDEFKKLYLEEFKENLTDDEAQEIAQRVIRFFHILKYGSVD